MCRLTAYDRNVARQRNDRLLQSENDSRRGRHPITPGHIRAVIKPGAVQIGRTNPNYVNLNRNFPTTDWRYLAYDPKTENFSGDTPGSGAETSALVRCFADISPSLVINLSDVKVGAVDFNNLVARYELLQAAADLLDLDISRIKCDDCTGTLTTFVNENYGDSFFVGLPPTFNLSAYADALIQVAALL